MIKTLRENGIQVTALHSHMLTEEPRLLFMHFWANDDAVNWPEACTPPWKRWRLQRISSRPGGDENVS